MGRKIWKKTAFAVLLQEQSTSSFANGKSHIDPNERRTTWLNIIRKADRTSVKIMNK